MNTENNKLIAEFMGKKELITESQFLSMEHKAHNPTIIEYLKYDTDWNWLMEVVEKIESLKFYPKNSTCIGFDSFGIEINKERCDITRYGDFTNHLIQGNGRTRIETVYNACVEFIKWYNQQNK